MWSNLDPSLLFSSDTNDESDSDTKSDDEYQRLFPDEDINALPSSFDFNDDNANTPQTPLLDIPFNNDNPAPPQSQRLEQKQDSRSRSRSNNRLSPASPPLLESTPPHHIQYSPPPVNERKSSSRSRSANRSRPRSANRSRSRSANRSRSRSRYVSDHKSPSNPAQNSATTRLSQRSPQQSFLSSSSSYSSSSSSYPPSSHEDAILTTNWVLHKNAALEHNFFEPDTWYVADTVGGGTASCGFDSVCVIFRAVRSNATYQKLREFVYSEMSNPSSWDGPRKYRAPQRLRALRSLERPRGLLDAIDLGNLFLTKFSTIPIFLTRDRGRPFHIDENMLFHISRLSLENKPLNYVILHSLESMHWQPLGRRFGRTYITVFTRYDSRETASMYKLPFALQTMFDNQVNELSRNNAPA